MNDTIRPPQRRILVMDDNLEIHKDFKKILSSGGRDGGTAEHEATEALLFGGAPEAERTPPFEIDSAFQGEQGLEMVRRAVGEKSPYPVAFVDVRMPPGWDGIETISRVWEVDSDLQVIICTAYSDYSLNAMVAKLGRPDQFVILKKPFDVVEVKQLADAMVAKWEELQKTRRQIAELQHSVDDWMSELRASQQTAAGIVCEINEPAQELLDNTCFLHEAFTKLNRLLWCHTELLKAIRARKIEEELVGQVEQAMREADLDNLVPRIPEVLRKSMEQARAVARIVGKL
jgi:CheY-like chemotaxis protein